VSPHFFTDCSLGSWQNQRRPVPIRSQCGHLPTTRPERHRVATPLRDIPVPLRKCWRHSEGLRDKNAGWV